MLPLEVVLVPASIQDPKFSHCLIYAGHNRLGESTPLTFADGADAF